MSENEDQSPFGRGFIAAAIVIIAILACGGVLLVTGLTADPTPAGDQTSATDPSGRSGANGSTTDGVSQPGATPGAPQPAGEAGAQPTGAQPPGSGADSGVKPGADTSGAQPAGEAGAQPTGSTSTGSGTANRCGLADGAQGIPSDKAPTADGWEVNRRVVVPRSAAYGPAKTDSDGFRHCFAHSPTGAVYAAYNVLAALADQTKAIPTARKLMLPGRDADALLEQLKAESADGGSEPTQLAGYRVLDASRDRATIMLALPVETEYMSATITLTWYAGDWRLVPPVNDNPVGAPYSQHRDLDGFVAWSGV